MPRPFLSVNIQVHTISFADMKTTGVFMRTKDGFRICHGILYRPKVEAILVKFYDPPGDAELKVFSSILSKIWSLIVLYVAFPA
jgi:hypothetical protein